MTWDTILWALSGAAVGVLVGLAEAWGDHRRGRVGPGRAEWLRTTLRRVPLFATLWVGAWCWDHVAWKTLLPWVFVISGWWVLGAMLYTAWDARWRDLLLGTPVWLTVTAALYLVLVFWLDGQRSGVSDTLAAAHLGAALCGATYFAAGIPSGQPGLTGPGAARP